MRVEFMKPWKFCANGHHLIHAKQGEIHDLPAKLAESAHAKGIGRILGHVETKACAGPSGEEDGLSAGPDAESGALEPRPKLMRRRKAKSDQ